MAGVVIDASVAVKWFLPEDRTGEALRYREGSNELFAPSHLLLEVFHAVWRQARAGALPFHEVSAAALILKGTFSSLVPVHELFEPASALSAGLPFPIYDCLYLALGQREDAEVVTADERMFAAARKARIKARLL